jgi:hypothetical protein
LTTPIDSGITVRGRIAKKYPSLEKEDISGNRILSLLDHRRDDVEKYSVIFWHRLLKSIYQEPLEIECEFRNGNHEGKANTETAIFRKARERSKWAVIGKEEAFASKIEAGEIKPFPVNWKYLIRLSSGGIVEMGTRDKNTVFYIAQVMLLESSLKNDRDEAEKFINLILEEANRVRGQLFNPLIEFRNEESLRLYLLFNVYLSNYFSARTMLGIAESQEADLGEEFLRFDARTSDLHNEGKRKHIDQHMLTCGMFYCSAITFFFMALEGFVNLVFHAFLKKTFRDKDFNIDQRFDLEQKLRFMTSICEGFNQNSELSSIDFTRFKKMKNYRNSSFHSKVEDSLQSLCFVEDGFVYTYDMDEHKDPLLPPHKIKLTAKDVIEVKGIVDEIVGSILKSMNHDARMRTETYILKEPHIPFVVSEAGDLVLGRTDERFCEPA